MDALSIDKTAELREGLIALLTRVDKVERQAGVDLSSIQLEIEALLDKIDRGGRGRYPHESAIMTFDRLLSLDSGFTTVTERWADVRRTAGIAAATEIIKQADLYNRWRDKWGDSTEYAWRARAEIEERDARIEARGRPRPGTETMPYTLALDLRYGTELPLSRIAEFFNLSASAVQARVAAFETRVAEEIAIDTIQRQLSEQWRLETRPDGGDFELREAVPSDSTGERAIHFNVVPVWRERDGGAAGRPRETGVFMGRGSGASRMWVVVFFVGPRVVFVPEIRFRAYTKGTSMMRHAPIDKIIQLAPHLGYESLDGAIGDMTPGTKAEEA